MQTSGAERFTFFRSFKRRLVSPLILFVSLLAVNLLLPLITRPYKYLYILDRIADILLTLSFAGMLIALVQMGEDYAVFRYDLKKENNLRERKIRTQLEFLRKMLIGVIVIITVCMVLLSFPQLRKIGTGLLTGVGVGGIIIGFAAQKSLANLLAGFQIAFTQPLRIDDVLVVEGEWGRVEEITLTYVVLSIWDERRLILPITYFIEKPFQNWTRISTELLGTVFLYADYTLPIEPLRAELDRLVHLTPLWDRRIAKIQVTNLTERTIELRILVSAQNASNAFDLRCYVREKLISFVQEHYPQSLPRERLEWKSRPE